MENWKKPKRKRRGKLPRILVEWICGKCDKVHRISFAYSFRPVWWKKRKGIRAKWGDRHTKFKLTKVKLEHETTLSEMNEFLNSLFSEKYEAKQYVKIYYPKELLALLIKNEEETRALIPKLTHSSIK